MGKKMHSKPELSEIVRAVAGHFKIPEDELLNPRDFPKGKHGLARLTAIFVAAKAGYLDFEIAPALHYRDTETVSTRFNAAQRRFSEASTIEDREFAQHCRAVAGTCHVSLS